MKPRIIVCGLGHTGHKIFSLLRQQGAIVVGISDRPIRSETSDVIVGNLQAASTLLAAGIQKAHTLVIAGDDDAVNLAILMQARILNPQIRIINRLFNTSLGDRLDRTLPDHASMSVSSLAAPVFAFAALGNRAIGHLRLFVGVSRGVAIALGRFTKNISMKIMLGKIESSAICGTIAQEC